MELSFAADGQAEVKTSIGSPMVVRGQASNGRALAAAAPAGTPANGRGSGGSALVLQPGGAPGGRYLQLLLLASCFMAALAAVGTCTRLVGMAWLA